MKKYLKYEMLTMILPLFFLSSCEKDDDPLPPAPTSFETLVSFSAARIRAQEATFSLSVMVTFFKDTIIVLHEIRVNNLLFLTIPMVLL